MKEFFAFVKKEFLHIFRDTKTLLVLVGLPTALIVLFGFAISTEIRNVNVGLFFGRRLSDRDEATPAVNTESRAEAASLGNMLKQEEEKEEKVEEVKEEEKEEEVKELLSEGLRKRKKSAHFHVSSQTRNK